MENRFLAGEIVFSQKHFASKNILNFSEREHFRKLEINEREKKNGQLIKIR